MEALKGVEHIVTYNGRSIPDSVIFENVLRLLESNWNRRLKVRLLGVRASNLEKAVFQLNLLEAPQKQKLDRLMRATDRVREKFGFDAVRLARSLDKRDEPPGRKARR